MATYLNRLALGARSVPPRRLTGRIRVGRPASDADLSLDRLTGLGDHWAFQEALRQEVALARRFREPFVLVLLDVDDFTFVNDNLGRGEGDKVLVALAGALRAGRSVDRAFRLGGDDFALIMTHTGLENALRPVERFRRAALSRMAGITLSLGLAEFDPTHVDIDPSIDAAAMRARAARALAEAKRRGRNQVATYTEMAESAPWHTSAATIAAVRRLLVGRHMGAAFQPIWNLTTHRILGFEALARPSAEYGLAGPRDAFEGAARLGSVGELDALCRESALAQVRDLPDDLLLFLNIAPEVFDHDGETSRQILREVQAAGRRPDQVVIELPENVHERIALVDGPVQDLRDRGFQLALDGFGSGDGALGLLTRVRPEYVKIDRDVVSSARTGGSGRAVLAAIVAYAAESGAVVIAEGIETKEILQHLVSAAKSVSGAARFVGGQGFLLGRPDPEPLWRRSAMTWPLPGRN
ncbi:bifunctional diguanylate cyclase/phosphodiesterase [Pengzhenrongella frigida]|uniref:Bifunctional diguanylate cyclase/phosphodiesterase n=1 Tax=Pengzhenrongella frigida TaxID=1259133 RepID=A0A4Q5N069_9MICO|nr:bifunctional diguanylate cyclase/phosphodiesterase [Cellulomonas sp. HLT2-17]RYV51419.1 bifunctional diguanylate cyclase/phosphodiesterase [Cellulomonas sp. HLT2-17]